MSVMISMGMGYERVTRGAGLTKVEMAAAASERALAGPQSVGQGRGRGTSLKT